MRLVLIDANVNENLGWLSSPQVRGTPPLGIWSIRHLIEVLKGYFDSSRFCLGKSVVDGPAIGGRVVPVVLRSFRLASFAGLLPCRSGPQLARINLGLAFVFEVGRPVSKRQASDSLGLNKNVSASRFINDCKIA